MQNKTPILDILTLLANQPHAAFYAPGHKRGQGISPYLADLLGKSVFLADLPELPELDNLFAPTSAIAAAQELAAAAFGADKTWFLINGSTCGIIAAILATCHVGDKIILPRNIHQSAIAGLILSGAIPIFINPQYDAEIDIAYSITPQSLTSALQQHPDAKAVMIVYPTYQGICADLKAIATITHSYNIPLLVDEAHGAHLGFHPDLPPSALSVGADLSVQSTHKTLGAMTQASMLHTQGNLLDTDRITKALQLVQSTSPSYILLASLDAARQQIALQGKELLQQTLKLADLAKNYLSAIPSLSVLKKPDFFLLDQTRLTVNVSQLGLSGYEADEILHQQLGVTAELPIPKHLTFIISIGNTLTDIEKLIAGFIELSQMHKGETEKKSFPNSIFPTSFSQNILSPREAFFAPTTTLPIKKTIGCISAELVCPYPPGIPVLMPGEKICLEALDYLLQIKTHGGNITGCSDNSLDTLKIINK